MKTIGFNQPLYILPFDHRASFETEMFGWHGDLTAAQTAEIAAAKQVVYEGFKSAVASGVPKEKAGILVDEHFGAAILHNARANGFITARPAEKSGQQEFDFEYGEDCEGIVAIATRGGRQQVGCIILGRGENDQKVREWLATAASVAGFIGFAVGRTDFWQPLVKFRAGQAIREEAVREIARRYEEFVNIFERARSS